MKNTLFVLASLMLLGLPARLLAQEPPVVVLVDSKFERPNNSTAFYPPKPGEAFKVLAGSITAWSGKEGRIGLTYANGYGLDGSGGIHVYVHNPSLDFMTVYIRGIPMPMLKDSLPMTEPIRSLQFEIAAKLPISKTVEIYLTIATPKGMDPEIAKGAWGSRLYLGKITGTGEFQTYKISGTEIPDKKISNTIRHIRDLYLNGMTETISDLTFDLMSGDWHKDDEFLMDNVRLTIASK